MSGRNRLPDLVHLHNLHGEYFDLRAIAAISSKIPVLWTLHDQWAFTGHCAYSIACTRWEQGCGQCPDLDLYPAVSVDATSRNHRRKAWIYARSRIHVATPSKWLLDQIDRSPLALGVVHKRHIPNGVDTEVFTPGDRQQARTTLGLPQKARVLLFSGYAATLSPFKDFETVRLAVDRYARTLKPSDPKLVLVALGQNHDPVELANGAKIYFFPYDSDQRRVVDFYRACDAYVHAAKADTFPNVILEALACGRPVAATRVGGIPEQIQAIGMASEPTGALAAAGDADALAQAIHALFELPERYQQMCTDARTSVEKKFSFRDQVQVDLSWYREILGLEHSQKAA